jgi:hypothetical protein
VRRSEIDRKETNIISWNLYFFSSSSLTVSSICVFPPEFVGEYILQRSPSYVAHHNAPLNSEEVIQYSSINITSDEISPFGQCIARNNSNYIVVLRCDHKSLNFKKTQKILFINRTRER